MNEHFKPAGHKAQELSEIVLPEETFKPIQRVIDTTIEGEDKTIGYLYHDVEYTPGVIDGFVLSKGVLCDTDRETTYKSTLEWQVYERNDTKNPIKWFVPPGPIILELCYQTQHNHSPLAQEIKASWQKAFNDPRWWMLTSTILQYNDDITHVYHDWTTDAGIASVPGEKRLSISDNNSPIANQFLCTILGKRFSIARQVFGQYSPLMQLWTPEGNARYKCALVLGVSNGKFDIGADNDVIYSNGSARGVALAKKLLEDKRYEVRDD